MSAKRSAGGPIQGIKSVYRDLIVRRAEDQHFWILCSFTLTFVAARLIVHFFPSAFLNVRGQHVHHFAYGIMLLAVSGYLAIVRTKRPPVWLAVMFGVGLALAVDETGMWLHLTDYYYNETSENALILVSALLINAVYFRKFWMGLLKGTINLFKK